MPDHSFQPKPLAEILAPQSRNARQKVQWRRRSGEIKPLWAILGNEPPYDWAAPGDNAANTGRPVRLAQSNALSGSGGTGEDHSGHRHIHLQPGGPDGPGITFENNVEGAPSPNLPVTNATARMVEEIAREIGVDININSTTGGGHAKNSNHYRKKAVDINRVNGQPVGPNNEAANRLQKAFRNHPNIREHFGPYINEKTDGGVTSPRPEMRTRHLTHIHVSGQE